MSDSSPLCHLLQGQSSHEVDLESGRMLVVGSSKLKYYKLVWHKSSMCYSVDLLLYVYAVTDSRSEIFKLFPIYTHNTR